MKDEYVDMIPPTDKDLEMATIGTLLFDGYFLNKFASELNPEIFFYEENRIISKAITDLFAKNVKVDLISVVQNLKEKNLLEKIGGAFYVSTLMNRVSGTANFEYYFRVLQEKYLKRCVLEISSRYIQHSFDESKDVFGIINKMIGELESITTNLVSNQIAQIRDVHIENIEDSLKVEKEGISSGVKTGLRAVDSLTNGWQKSDLIIIAGRPSMGKTAVAMNMVLHPAIQEKKSVLVFSLEMSKQQLTGRVESLLSEIDVSRIIKKQLSKDEIVNLDNSCQSLYYAPIYIDDTPNISLIELKSKARKMYSEKKVELIVIDYLQLMRSGLNIGNREQEIAEISRGLKALAKELNIPVIALSQLSRVVEGRADKKPMLSDLRESGQIEQDADMVVFCYRPEYYGIENYELDGESFNSKGLFMLLWAKHRNGELGEIPLRFIHHLTKISNYDTQVYNNEFNPKITTIENPF